MPTESTNRVRPAGHTRKLALDVVGTRELLIRCGMELLTERGYGGTVLEAVLQKTGIPKGSFYHHFRSKDAFGIAVLAAYDEYFQRKLSRWLSDESVPPLARIRRFVEDAKRGMARHRFTRGCLVGNFGQELGVLPDNYRGLLNDILDSWAARIETCLEAARRQGHIPASSHCPRLAQFFWIGWEGAVMRARMKQNAEPLDAFIDAYLETIAIAPDSGCTR